MSPQRLGRQGVGKGDSQAEDRGQQLCCSDSFSSLKKIPIGKNLIILKNNANSANWAFYLGGIRLSLRMDIRIKN